jgi:DNA-binding transcriptional LysR family regulator
VPLRRNIDIDLLRTFVSIVETGSFTRTAERIGLPKSTLSRRITLLEERLGERLIQRTTRRLALTEFGLLLLEHARQISAEVDAVSALSEYRQIFPSGKLRVSMPNDIAKLLLNNMLSQFIACYPAVSLELDLSPRRVDLLGENFDLALRMGDLPDDTLLAAHRLAVLTCGLYASPQYLERRGIPAHPDDLLHHDTLRIFERDREPVGWSLKRSKQRWQGTPRQHSSANSPEVLVMLACAGAGIASVPDVFAEPGLQQGALTHVLPDWQVPSHTAWAVFPGRRLMPAKTRAFIEMLETALSGKAPSANIPSHPPAPRT